MTTINRFQIITAVLTIVCTTATFAVAQSTTVAGIDIDQMRASGYRLDWMNQSNGSAISLPTITTDSFVSFLLTNETNFPFKALKTEL